MVKYVLHTERKHTNELSVYFVTTEEITRLHKEFFHDPSPTDCISFPLDQEEGVGYHILGEVFICPKTAIDYLLQSGEEINEDSYRETTLYLVHGLLHLIGYKDINDEDRKNMRAAEQRLMEPLIRQKLLLKP
ncbi:MAG: rRNA maturation RNase YbeY [Chlamydiales bacterium]|nr:rRNA maturation RNase YbeY [Chlamydiales bacterium]